MIRVIFPNGTVSMYDTATDADPAVDNGTSCINIYNKHGKLAAVYGSCIIDGGDGIILTADLANMLNLTRAEAAKAKCRVCGCTQENCKQCIEKTGSPCYWIEEDLCSACAPKPKRKKK